MLKVHELLKHFSLSETEIDIYLAVLSLDKPGVSDIAKRIEKNRTAVYFHIKNLLEKGLLKETRKGRKLIFAALSPSQLAERLDHLVTDFKGLVAHLETLKKIDAETPFIEITESKKGYEKIYDQISSLPRGSILRVIEGRKALISELKLVPEEQWNSFFQRVIERNIQTKGIFTQESLALPFTLLSGAAKKHLTDRIWHVRTLPEEQLPFQHLLFIYGSTIAFLFPDASLVISIRHLTMAQSFTSIFDALYEFARPQPNVWKS